jgi:hypothetical protein
MYLECREAEPLTPCSGCLLLHRCVYLPLNNQLPGFQRMQQNLKWMYSQGSLLLPPPLWYGLPLHIFKSFETTTASFQVRIEQEEIFMISPTTEEGNLGIALFGAIIDNSILSGIEGLRDHPTPIFKVCFELL